MRFLLIGSLTLAVFSAGLLPATDWPRWRGADGSGRWNPGKVPPSVADREPQPLWKVSIGGGYGGVTVSAGRVYVMDRQKSPEEIERVLCFDQATGKSLWQHTWPADYGSMDYATGPRSSVTLLEGRAYTLGATGVACCLNAATGEKIWQVDTVQEHGAQIPTWGFAASPLLDGTRVLLHVGAEKGGSVIALHKETGKLLWKGGPDPAGYCTPQIIQPTPERKELIVWGPEHIQSLEPDTGKLLWLYPYKITYGVSIAQPLYEEDTLLVSGYWHGTKALKIQAPTSSPAEAPPLLWENEKEMCGLMSSPLYREGVVYLLDKNKGLQAIRLATGEILWSDGNTLTPKDRNPQMSLVWLDEPQNLAALLNASGELVYVKLTPEEREELGRYQIIGKTWAHPAFVGNRIYARSDSELAAWQLWE